MAAEAWTTTPNDLPSFPPDSLLSRFVCRQKILTCLSAGRTVDSRIWPLFEGGAWYVVCFLRYREHVFLIPASDCGR